MNAYWKCSSAAASLSTYWWWLLSMMACVSAALLLLSPVHARFCHGQQDTASRYTEQVLATNGDDAIDPVLGKYYRIVALADVGHGVLLAAYDGRPDDGDSPSPNSIVQRRTVDGGRSWSPPSFIARGQLPSAGEGEVLRYGFSDPSYVVDREAGVVFNFHTYSKDQGFAGSSWANNDTDRQVLSAEVSVSLDYGLSWSTDPASQLGLPRPSSYPPLSKYAVFAGPLITNVTKPAGVKGMFASSGNGIQLRIGTHKGRLLQQYAGVVMQSDGNTTAQAYTIYSDDHGRSWQRGAFTGSAMDENKVLELADARVLLNSRDSSHRGGRWVAESIDGGDSYGPVTYDHNLTDPTNNAGFIRMYPSADPDTPHAKMLLFSNAQNATSRVNGTVRLSCDDGVTWSSGEQFKAGSMGYSTLITLSANEADCATFGLLYEGDHNAITFASFNVAWVGECPLTEREVGKNFAPSVSS